MFFTKNIKKKRKQNALSDQTHFCQNTIFFLSTLQSSTLNHYSIANNMTIAKQMTYDRTLKIKPRVVAIRTINFTRPSMIQKCIQEVKSLKINYFM